MQALAMVPLASLPEHPPPGVSPDLLVLSSHTLSASIGLSPGGMERLARRHGRELRAYGPIIKGQEPGELLLTSDQCDLLRLVSETPHGVADRAKLLTSAAMVLLGLSILDPALPAFRTPDEVRRFAAPGRF